MNGETSTFERAKVIKAIPDIRSHRPIGRSLSSQVQQRLVRRTQQVMTRRPTEIVGRIGPDGTKLLRELSQSVRQYPAADFVVSRSFNARHQHFGRGSSTV